MSDDIKTIEDDIDAMKRRWSNRRRMAWTSLISMIVITAGSLFTGLVAESKLAVMSDMITWFYFCCTSVIGTYMGVTTYAAIKGK